MPFQSDLTSISVDGGEKRIAEFNDAEINII